MKKAFLILLIIGVITVLPTDGEAHPGSTDNFGCHVCTEGDCFKWQVPYQQKHCHIKPTSPSKPSASDPTCPRYSSYSVVTERCECFQGFYAEGGSCRRDREGDQICREKFGKGVLYSEESKACYCREDYQMTDGKPECVVKTPVTESAEIDPGPIPYKSFGRDFSTNLNDSWAIQSRVFSISGKNIAKLQWKMLSASELRTAKKHKITIWRAGRRLGSRTTPNQNVRTVYFFFEKNQQYMVEISAVNETGKEFSSVQFEFES